MGKYADKIYDGFSRIHGLEDSEWFVNNTLIIMAEAFDELNDKIDKLGESRDSNGLNNIREEYNEQ